MTEPTSTTAAALGGSVITVAGIATGLPDDLILPAFCGALWALRGLDESGILARVSQVVAGTLIAAWSAPALSLMASASLGVDPQFLRFPLAALIGWGGLRHLLPRVGQWMDGRKGGAQ